MVKRKLDCLLCGAHKAEKELRRLDKVLVLLVWGVLGVHEVQWCGRRWGSRSLSLNALRFFVTLKAHFSHHIPSYSLVISSDNTIALFLFIDQLYWSLQVVVPKILTLIPIYLFTPH